ncbi:hypothetical protein [Sphingomonas sp. G-3-2-10]|uniref:hypothetical protein n=1 Tax=Sphingomonas sp. G-3-2-10 TaxID=2728838 RepID=UPI00146A192D|nr:hypothetical protein [Sphingomonas sp. G-3-2-10]NML07308.1 hypothetical protein [Sphingomonas sp. G-3-2-10]
MARGYLDDVELRIFLAVEIVVNLVLASFIQYSFFTDMRIDWRDLAAASRSTAWFASAIVFFMYYIWSCRKLAACLMYESTPQRRAQMALQLVKIALVLIPFATFDYCHYSHHLTARKEAGLLIPTTVLMLVWCVVYALAGRLCRRVES